MTDVIELILADHRRILRLVSVLDRTGRTAGDVSADTALASVWEWLANLIDVHLCAEDEICGMALRATGLDCGPDHEDIRAAMGETFIAPPGSPGWWRAVGAVTSRCASQFCSEEESLLALRDGTSLAFRSQLANKWRAYVTAHTLDLAPKRRPADAGASLAPPQRESRPAATPLPGGEASRPVTVVIQETRVQRRRGGVPAADRVRKI